ncbi:MAG TPA: hypothetical protein VGL34_08235 [Steroidobacteraceae bacterium]
MVIAERLFILNEEARGAAAQPFVHLGQREGYLAYPVDLLAELQP